MDNQIINCRCRRERRNNESNWSGLYKVSTLAYIIECFKSFLCVTVKYISFNESVVCKHIRIHTTIDHTLKHFFSFFNL